MVSVAVGVSVVTGGVVVVVRVRVRVRRVTVPRSGGRRSRAEWGVRRRRNVTVGRCTGAVTRCRDRVGGPRRRRRRRRSGVRQARSSSRRVRGGSHGRGKERRQRTLRVTTGSTLLLSVQSVSCCASRRGRSLGLAFVVSPLFSPRKSCAPRPVFCSLYSTPSRTLDMSEIQL